jgi:hypothetical protein
MQLSAACRGGGFYSGQLLYNPPLGCVLDAGLHTLVCYMLCSVCMCMLCVCVCVCRGGGFYSGQLLYNPPLECILDAGLHTLVY